MSKTFTDSFVRANGQLNNVPSGPAYDVLSGTFAVASNKGTSTTAPSANPIAVVPTSRRSNGSADAEVTLGLSHAYGNAIYARLQDANNWIRLVARSDVQTGYYTTYQYEVGTQLYYYNQYYNEKQIQQRILEKEVRYVSSCTLSAYGGISQKGSQTGCLSSPPSGGISQAYGAYCGNQIHEEAWAITNSTGCSSGTRHYIVQYRDRTETPVYSTKWVGQNYSLAANESFTGNQRYTNVNQPYWAAESYAVNGTLLVETGSHRSTFTSGQGYATPPTNTVDYTYTAVPANNGVQYSGSYYYATSPNKPIDRATGASQQNPTSSESPTVALQKCVAGLITTLQLYSVSATSIALRCEGTTLTVKVNGTTQGTVAEAAFQTARFFGWGGGQSQWTEQNPSITSFTVAMLAAERVRVGSGWQVANRKARVGSTWVDFDTRVLTGVAPAPAPGYVARLDASALAATIPAGAVVASAPAVGANAAWTPQGGGPTMRYGGVAGRAYLEQSSAGSTGLQFNQSLVSASTVFVAARMSGGTQARILSGINNNWLLGWHAGTQDDLYAMNWVNDSPTPATNTLIIYAVHQTGGVSRFFRNGALKASGSGTQGPNGITTNGYPAGSSEMSDAHVYDVIAYDTALSDAAIATTFDYLMDKYYP